MPPSENATSMEDIRERFAHKAVYDVKAAI